MGGRYLITGNQLAMLSRNIREHDPSGDGEEILDAIFKSQFIGESNRSVEKDAVKIEKEGILNG